MHPFCVFVCLFVFQMGTTMCYRQQKNMMHILNRTVNHLPFRELDHLTALVT